MPTASQQQPDDRRATFKEWIARFNDRVMDLTLREDGLLMRRSYESGDSPESLAEAAIRLVTDDGGRLGEEFRAVWDDDDED